MTKAEIYFEASEGLEGASLSHYDKVLETVLDLVYEKRDLDDLSKVLCAVSKNIRLQIEHYEFNESIPNVIAKNKADVVYELVYLAGQYTTVDLTPIAGQSYTKLRDAMNEIGGYIKGRNNKEDYFKAARNVIQEFENKLQD